MSTFIFAAVGLYALNAILHLATALLGEKLTPANTINLALTVGMAVWGASLLL